MSFPSLVILGTLLMALAPAESPKPFPGTVSRWEGFVRHDFQVDGADVIVVEPDKPLPGRPWAWRGEFFGAFPNADIELLKAGWHLAYIGVPDLFGSPEGDGPLGEVLRRAGEGPRVEPEARPDRPEPGCPLLHGVGGGPPRQDAAGLPRQRRLRLQELAGRQAEGAGHRATARPRSGRSC